MHWATLFFTSEVTFLFGSDVAVVPVVAEGKRALVRMLWGVRVALLAVAYTLYVEDVGAVAVGVVLGCAGLAYIGSWSYAMRALDKSSVDPFLWGLSHVSVVNWLFAFPFAAGSKGNGPERLLWLFVNFVAGLVVLGVALTDEPLNVAYSCYPPTVPTEALGSYGICPQSRYGTTQTCNGDMGGALTAYATCDGSIGRNFGSTAIRVATYIAAASLGVYVVSMGRNRRRAAL
jgi:hypothetical protein